jgi:hypothetical protein
MARLNAWKARHPSWTLVIHSRSEAETLLEKEFPWLGPLYKGLPKIQQADLLRLLFVYVHGGLYIDIDVRCARPLEETLARAGFDPLMDSLVAFVEGSAVFSSDAVTLASAHHPLRNGIPEIRTRIANYIFFCPQKRSQSLFAVILHVASRLARWQALSPGQRELIEKRPWDPEYITLFLTGPDAFTEAVFGGPNVSPLGGVLIVNEHLSRAYSNVGSGSWRNSTYACRMWGIACL